MKILLALIFASCGLGVFGAPLKLPSLVAPANASSHKSLEEVSAAHKSRALRAPGNSYLDQEAVNTLRASSKTALVFGRSVPVGPETRLPPAPNVTTAWEEIPGSPASTWQLVMESDGSTSHSVLFSQLHLPKGAVLYVYGLQQSEGLLTLQDLIINGACEGNPGCEVLGGTRKALDLGRYATIPLSGDRVVLRYVPAAVRGASAGARATQSQGQAGPQADGRRGGSVGPRGTSSNGSVAAGSGAASGEAPTKTGSSIADVVRSVIDRAGAALGSDSSSKDAPLIEISAIVQGMRPLPGFSTTAAPGAAKAKAQRSEAQDAERRRLVAVRKLNLDESPTGRRVSPSPAPSSEESEIPSQVEKSGTGAPLGAAVSSDPFLSVAPGPADETKATFDTPWWILGSLGSAGRCEIPVMCGIEEFGLSDWVVEKQSVVQLMINGPTSASMCTGTLLADPTGQNRSIILTAHHCFSEGSDPPPEDFAMVNAVFDYEAMDCASGIVRPVRSVMHGTTPLWVDEESDTILMQLVQPIAASFNAYAAGWEITGPFAAGPESALVMHHPRGDAKKISTSVRRSLSSGDRAFTIFYTNGTTEPGSSGAALFDESSRRVVGALSGGAASCDDLGGSDVYIRLSYAWERGMSEVLGRIPANGTQPSQLVVKTDGTWVGGVPDSVFYSSARGVRAASGALVVVAAILCALAL